MFFETKKVKVNQSVFPTNWQAVIFRNYGFVPVENIAKILECSVETVEQERERLGLNKTAVDFKWVKKGYITLIRNNWYLLPSKQICDLIGITETRLDFILQNDDFLSVKLGDYKPYCESVTYAPLSFEQIKKTDKLAKEVKKYQKEPTDSPFNFFVGKNAETTACFCQKGTRIVHGYLSPCGDAFMGNSEDYMPDELLQNYAKSGINGVWLHGVLSALSPYPFDENLSADYKIRRKNLNGLIARCAKFGIKVYLYFNEPRSLPKNKIGKFERLIGREENGLIALCFEQKEVKNYLYNAVKDLLCAVKDLGGIITITMSENLTHCNYRPRTNCPICKHVPPEQSASSVNNVIQKAITDSGSKAELIANLWGWSPFSEWTENQTLKGVELLDEKISVMCVSEYDLDVEKGGIKSRIIDYSISNPGPSEITRKTLEKATQTGHKVYAKIQVNNSWECSAIPYLPVFDLLYEHLKNLTQIGVENYMLTWTLGGYPSPMLGLVSAYAQNADNFSLDEWYKKEYGVESDTVKIAVDYFCKGFREYPFSLDSLYFSPKTLGSANLWSLVAEEKQSTMVCYAFDDYETWIKPYPVGVYLSQYQKLLSLWEQGLDVLESLKSKKAEELKIYAKGAYCHFKADYLQTEFSYLKRNLALNSEKIKLVIQNEMQNAQNLLSLIYQNACIGFEASNHYYYTDRNLIEKILSLMQMDV